MTCATTSVVKLRWFCYICTKHIAMKEDIRKLDNAQLSKAIQDKMQELIELRNELSRRMDEHPPIVNYDFTKRVTD